MSDHSPAPPSAAAPFRKALISVERNFDAGDWTIESGSIVPDAPQFSISKQRLRGGRQEGVDLIRIQAGRIAVTVVPTRGMGILRVDSADLALKWDSPVREVVHPQFVNLQSRGGLGWLEGFGEWLVRCGLEFAGGPGKDRFITNTGATAEMDLTLHGKIANIPASEVELVVDTSAPYMIRLRGRVDEAMFYGPKLELWTELQIVPNAAAFRIVDTVVNRGAAEQEFELIYHINYGRPFLGAGAQFAAPLQRVTPMNAHAAASRASFASYADPTPGFVEQVYCMRPLAGADGKAIVLLKNAAGTLASSIRFATAQLPCFTLWKNTGPLLEGYVTGLEPGTNFPNNRRVERAAGRLSKLKPGESREFALEVGLHTTLDDVDRVLEDIRAIQGVHQVQIDAEPEKQEKVLE